ncbi:hypothetical protein GCM10010193_69680 [Kitasatospora atroaurantiaca]|uniref:Uncharacterized protein n=1 Tax=Kitasatospora atroaurantiaca TaxID=285545 RepID=A0A561EN59_9ACTN|nr:hypothetical protein [Kitasatospora atroaurantiaca]TWE17053.1 hypothetical protein FB465_2057 [Kitasatospora atroaurantiaca]
MSASIWHHREAERLVAESLGFPEHNDGTSPEAMRNLAEAQVHATLATIPRGLPAGEDLMELLLDALADFQRTAKWPTLQHAQARGHLAECLSKSLTAAVLDNNTGYTGPVPGGV